MERDFDVKNIGYGAFWLSEMNHGDTSMKVNHDRYDVYVNNDFVGQKNLLNTGEDITDVNDFLYTQGFKNFTATLKGDHYHIYTDEQEDIANALNIYFQNR